MTTPTYQKSIPESEIYPQATEEESVKVMEIMAEAKKRAKLNRAKNPEEAWAKFDEARQKIIDFVNK
jgi:hypothetical protein